jgi:hypothetical protein
MTLYASNATVLLHEQWLDIAAQTKIFCDIRVVSASENVLLRPCAGLGLVEKVTGM